MTNAQMVILIVVPIAFNLTFFLYILARIDKIEEYLRLIVKDFEHRITQLEHK